MYVMRRPYKFEAPLFTSRSPHDASGFVDIAYIKMFSSDMGLQLAYDHLLSRLPESGRKNVADEVIQALRELKRSPVISFVGSRARSLIDGALGVLQKIRNQDKVIPETVHIPYPAWKGEILERCGHIFNFECVDEKTDETYLATGKKGMYDAIFVSMAINAAGLNAFDLGALGLEIGLWVPIGGPKTISHVVVNLHLFQAY